MYLNCHSAFSFRYGTLKVDHLLELANKNGCEALALTDINNTSACLNFIRQAKKVGIKPIVGIDFRNGVHQQYIGLAKNNEGFMRLNRHLSDYLETKQLFKPRAPELKDCYVIYPFSTCRNRFFQLGVNEYIGITLAQLKSLPFSIWKSRLDALVLLQPVTVDSKKGYNIHRLLRAIDQNTLLSKLSPTECCEPSDFMVDVEGLKQKLSDYPEILANTKKILDTCSINFIYKENQKSGVVNQNKQYYRLSKEEDRQRLRSLCYQYLPYRYPDKKDQQANIERLEKELDLIEKQGFASYFLINWDMLEYARRCGFFYVGRGSGANSIVAYLLQITDVDPVKLDLYFERFINPYRENPPDFDIDFSWKDRDKVVDYLFDKYGSNDQIALLATYNTFSRRSLVRELGKVFGLPNMEIENILKSTKKFKREDDEYAYLVDTYAKYMEGLPSHLSIHAGGVLISERPIYYFSATSMPPKNYRLVHFDMVHAEDVGLYKFDILSQRGLGKVKDTLELVKKKKDPELDIHRAEPFFEDEKVKSLLRNGETMGCFYVESPAMRMLLKKLKADHYLGLVAASSIIRPGVAKSGMMREYILRSQDQDPNAWRKKTPEVMQDLMKETYGVMVYQEDVIKVAHCFAKMTLAEADVLRRGMSGKFRSRDEFAKAKDTFFANCRKEGYGEAVIQDVWRQTESFAGYAFSKGHSASYAVESYQSLYLKAHYPMEFIVGVINNGGGFYSVEFYLHEARKLGATVHAPCINKSNYLTLLYGEVDLYMGLQFIADLETNVIGSIVKDKQLNGPYKDLDDFVNRCEISREQLALLIKAGCFRFTGKTREQLMWKMHAVFGASNKSAKHSNSLFSPESKSFDLPTLDDYEYRQAFDQMDLFGFPLCSPFTLLKVQDYPRTLVIDLPDYLDKGQIEIVGYLVKTKQTKTNSDQAMCFGTFLDLEGDWIDSVHFPLVLKQYPFKGKGCYLIRGRVVEEFGYFTIEVSSMELLPYVDWDENNVPQKRRTVNRKKTISLN